jgi:hypothetical protein
MAIAFIMLLAICITYWRCKRYIFGQMSERYGTGDVEEYENQLLKPLRNKITD